MTLHTAGGEPLGVRVIARRPDTIVGFRETRTHAETARFELRVSEIAEPGPDAPLTIGAEICVFRASRSGAIATGWSGHSTRGRAPGFGGEAE